MIGPNQAIRLRARKECQDRDSNPRVTGEEWLVKKTGAYLPGAYEEVISIVEAYVLTEKVIFLQLKLYGLGLTSYFKMPYHFQINRTSRGLE